MSNILVESTALVDAAVYRASGKGSVALYEKLETDQESGDYHVFTTTEYSIITAQRFLIDYSEANQLKRDEERQLLDEFQNILSEYYSTSEQYHIYRVTELDAMIQVGNEFHRLGCDADIEEAVLSYLAKGPFNGAQVIGFKSIAYEKRQVPMYFGFS